MRYVICVSSMPCLYQCNIINFNPDRKNPHFSRLAFQSCNFHDSPTPNNIQIYSLCGQKLFCSLRSHQHSSD